MQGRSKRGMAPAPTKSGVPVQSPEDIQTTYTDEVSPGEVGIQKVDGDEIEGLKDKIEGPEVARNEVEEAKKPDGVIGAKESKFLIKLDDGRSVAVKWDGVADESLDANFKIK